MSRLETYQQELYELRFSPMCKPAGEVSNLTQLESHTVRARAMMMWRIAAGHLAWGEREVELLYESTLDSISEAFDVFHYPLSRYMLDARADVWEAGLAPAPIQEIVAGSAQLSPEPAPALQEGAALFLGGELHQIDWSAGLTPLEASLTAAGVKAVPWMAPTGALAYALGARQAAREQAETIRAGIEKASAGMVIADGPETAWALVKVYPDLGVDLPDGLEVRLLSEALAGASFSPQPKARKVFFHDSRPAYLLAEAQPSHRAILPGYLEEESEFGAGRVYEAPREVLDSLGLERVYGTWTRALAKSCGADDGLWLTYPKLAAGLARQRLDYARALGAEAIVSDSPLCASYLAAQVVDEDPPVTWLPDFLTTGS